MRSVALLAALVWSIGSAAAAGVSRDEALSIAEREAVDRGVELEKFTLSRSRQEPSGEWSFLYECKPFRPDCRFLIVVNSNTGRVVAITSNVEGRRHKQTPSDVAAALAATSDEQCKARGGTWIKAGMARQEFCDIEASDAGKPCTDSAQCESKCIDGTHAPSGSKIVGRCDEWHHSLGRCVAEVRDGVTSGGLCVD